MWIDMDDRMPPVGEDVIIIYDCCGEPDIDIMKRQPYKDDIDLHIEYENAFINKRGFLTGDVTHWMPLNPLPKMYKDMEEENV